MHPLRKALILVVALLLTGAARLPLEQGLTGELREAGLRRPKLDIATRDHIDQTSSAVALGGLRTLVASILDLRAHVFFERRSWDELRKTYDTIVDLAPHTRYYWRSGSWHLAYNAASYYLHDSSLPPLRRRELWRTSIHQGRAFLERGIRNNPADWILHAHLGLMLIDPNKFVAFRDRREVFEAAAEAYRKAELDSHSPARMARFRLFALARVPGREAEALELARQLHAADPRHRTPTLKSLLYVLECKANPELDHAQLALELFGDAARAHEALSRLWLRNLQGYPTDGVARGIAALETRLGILMPESILGQSPLPPPDPSRWFSEP